MSSVPGPAAGLGKRLLRARLEASIAGPQKISQAELGRLVGEYLHATKAITGATVSRWEAEASLPDITTIGAIAVVCHVDPGWLAFGDLSAAPPPWASDDSTQRIRRERAILSEQFRADFHDLVNNAAKQDRKRLARLVARLRALPDNDTPESRRVQREIIAEMDGPGAMDRIARIHMTDEEQKTADRHERERQREQRMEWLQQDFDDGLITLEEFNEAYESEE